jgi:hypothetical protein
MAETPISFHAPGHKYNPAVDLTLKDSGALTCFCADSANSAATSIIYTRRRRTAEAQQLVRACGAVRSFFLSTARPLAPGDDYSVAWSESHRAQGVSSFGLRRSDLPGATPVYIPPVYHPVVNFRWRSMFRRSPLCWALTSPLPPSHHRTHAMGSSPTWRLAALAHLRRSAVGR